MAKKKILYLITQSEWGGAQEYVFNLAANLDKSQYDVLVLAGEGNNELYKELNKFSIPFQKLKYTKRAINPLFDFLALFELIKIFKKEKPDVIHLNSSKIGFLGSLAARLCQGFGEQGKFKIIYTAHGWVFNEPLSPFIKKLYFWIEKISAKWKNAIITVCEADRQIALKHNFTLPAGLPAGRQGRQGSQESKIVTIHNAVNPEQLNFLSPDVAKAELIKKIPRRDAPWRVSTKIIGTIANLYPTKGIDYLIKTAKILIPQHPDWIFIVIGEGPEKNNLKLKTQNLKLENNFFLLGNIPQAHRLLKGFDLFVLPSVKEGLPYAVLKAMAAQIPIVATKVGGLPEILPDECLVGTRRGAFLHDYSTDLADKIKNTLAGRLPLPHYQTNSFQEFLKKTIDLYTNSAD